MIYLVKEEDIEKIVLLEKTELGRTLGASYLTHLLTVDFAYLYKYVEDEEIIGYISFSINNDYLEVLNIAVNKNYQRKGIGSALLKRVDQVKNEKNIKSIILEVGITNTQAINFYTKNGFIKTITRKNYYHNGQDFEDAVVLIKE